MTENTQNIAEKLVIAETESGNFLEKGKNCFKTGEGGCSQLFQNRRGRRLMKLGVQEDVRDWWCGSH